MTAKPPATRRIVVLGDVMTDIVVRLRGPIATGSDTPAAISLHGGGSGANHAAWLATIDPSLDIHFIGCVGDDVLGAAHRATFAGARVAAHLAVDPLRPTGTLISLVDSSGERSMLPDRGANDDLSAADIPDEVFRPGAWLHVSGYTLLAEETRPVALEAMRLAREHEMSVSVDPASEALLRAAGRQHFIEWTRGADLCFPNLDEGRLLSGEDDPERVASALTAWYGGVALKLGARGALWGRRDETLLRQSCAPTTVVDTTGAGDAFCAGFLAQWLAGAPPGEALSAAVALSARAVAQVGARPPGCDLRV
jgi:sugar/nucleoside kinase (ribokinase family)